MNKSSLLVVLTFAWLISICAGIAVLSKYDKTPGNTSRTPETWPAGSSIRRDQSKATLVMFAHPQCPCTASSIAELNRLLVRCNSEATTHVLFLKFESMPENWTKSGNWREASSIPGIEVRTDSNREEATRFGAHTSGHVVLYDRGGRLLFSGGITSGRGHEGDNAGENLIVTALSGGKTIFNQTPVYGCALDSICTVTNEIKGAWK